MSVCLTRPSFIRPFAVSIAALVGVGLSFASRPVCADERAPGPAAPDAKADADPAPPTSDAHSERASGVVPPRALAKVDAVFPEGEPPLTTERTVVLVVTVEQDGRVGEVTVATSGGERFDAAAVSAVRAFTFEPASRDGVAMASRIKVPFRFAPPPSLPAPPAASAASPSGAPTPTVAQTSGANELTRPPQPTAPSAPSGAIEVDVRGRRVTPPRATSDFVLGREVLAAAPRRDAADLLSSAPGVYVAKPEGDAVAHELVLRGFDAAHGQDIELTLGHMVPLNQPSHVHGQGYADLNFLIPEVVQSVRVTEGVYDPRQGDFAVAGSVDFELGVSERGYRSRTTYGSFQTLRQLVLWAPKSQPEETFGAAVFRRTDGFGRNRGGLSGGVLGQFGFEGPGGFRGVALVSGYAARANLAGVLRRDDVEAGRLGFYDVVRDPSATAQSAFSGRALAAVRIARESEDGERTSLATWLGFVDYRSRENFTGYTQRSRTNPDWVGRGDLIEQGNQDLSLGARAEHRTRRFEATSWLEATFELGLSASAHRIEQQQNLLQVPENATWDRRIDASIRTADLGLYVDADLKVTRYVRVRGGLRGDLLAFDVADALGNFTPAFQRQTHLPGFRRTALGAAFGPRVSVEGRPTRWLDLFAAYGQGYRSPQALQLSEGESAPFAKVHSVEGGAKLHPLRDKLTLSAAGYATFLSTDLAFDPAEGALSRVGPTTRAGFVAHVVARPTSWLFGAASITYVHATLDEPPTATAENPSPSFIEGQLLPYVPPLVVRADGAAERRLASFAGGHLVGRLGAGFSFLSPRPLPYGRFADPVALLDAQASARFRMVELALEVMNVAGSEYAATEYSFVSDWRSEPLPSRVPARHFAAGQPRTFLASLGLQF